MHRYFEIEFKHSEPVSLFVVHETLVILYRAATNSATRFLLSDACTPLLDSDVKRLAAHALVDQYAKEFFLLESVESGSSKFKGVVTSAIFFILGTVTGGFVPDILEKSEVYQQFTTDTAKHFDNLVTMLIEEIQDESSRQNGPDPIQLEIIQEADRIRIIVYPRNRQTEIVKLI